MISLNGEKEQRQEERVELTGRLSEFREALEEEIAAIKSGGHSSTTLKNGIRLEGNGDGFQYSFVVDYCPNLPSDTPCKLIVGNEQFDVTAISVSEDRITLFSKKPLPDTIAFARLENGATVLHERLIACIEENAETTNDIGNKIISESGMPVPAKKVAKYKSAEQNSSLNEHQKIAVCEALTNDTTFIWGPPGTGKTTVIGTIISELYRLNRSVLVVSHTNTAVDSAIEKIAKEPLVSKSPCPVLRYGTPTPGKSLDERVLLDSHIKVLGNDLMEKKNQLENKISEKNERIRINEAILNAFSWRQANHISDIFKQYEQIKPSQEKIKEQEKNLSKQRTVRSQKIQAFPQYKEFEKHSKELSEYRRNLDEANEEISETQKFVKACVQKNQIARDEEKKHSIYHDRSQKMAQYFSESFYQHEISKLKSEIESIRVKLRSLSNEKNDLVSERITLSNKGRLARMFSGGRIESITRRVQEIEREITETTDVLHQKEDTTNKFEQDFAARRALQEELDRIKPSFSPEHWRTIAVDTEKRRAVSEQKVILLQKKREQLLGKIANAETYISSKRKQYNSIHEIEQSIYTNEESLTKLRSAISQSKKQCYQSAIEEFEKMQGLAPMLGTASSDIVHIQEIFQHDSNGAYDSLTDVVNTLRKLSVNINQALHDISKADVTKETKQLKCDLNDARAELEIVRQHLMELEKQAIMQASIVGTTLAKSYLSDVLRQRRFDTVILDEASMASIPSLWCASLLADRAIIIVGDFLQLPPIVIAPSKIKDTEIETNAGKWLGKDIFYHSGMQKAAESKKTKPHNFVMLNEQFRMEKEIADIANMYYGDKYGGLKSNDRLPFRVKLRQEFYDWFPGQPEKHCVQLIDTESLNAWVTGVPQGKGHSRLNHMSAAVCVDLAFYFLQNKLKDTANTERKTRVLIVAPYKPHVVRINKLIEIEYANRGIKDYPELIRAGTIHSFQGSEADIVIFDLVIDEPHWKANLFMTDKDVNEDLKKMFNVAITRARFKLYVVGNFNYCQKRAKDNALAALLSKLQNEMHLEKVDAKAILPRLSFTREDEYKQKDHISGKHLICREFSFLGLFISDIHSCQNRIIIYSPFISENRLAELVPHFSDLINQGKQIVVVTKAMSERGKREVAQYKKSEIELNKIGVAVVHKKGMHEKVIFIDDTIVWMGSLNVLSFNGTTGEVMERHNDREYALEYQKMFGINEINTAVEKTTQTDDEKELVCPICGGEMLICESDNGGIYWRCENKDYSRQPEQQYPKDGLLRCKCGAPYVFSMKSQPRWVCSENPKHYQIMRFGDLKLEKMAALIPTKKERREVDKYFKEKMNQ